MEVLSVPKSFLCLDFVCGFILYTPSPWNPAPIPGRILILISRYNDDSDIQIRFDIFHTLKCLAPTKDCF